MLCRCCAVFLGVLSPQNIEGVKYYRKPFEFLSLGIMAYVGNDRALTQVRGARFMHPQHAAPAVLGLRRWFCSQSPPNRGRQKACAPRYRQGLALLTGRCCTVASQVEAFDTSVNLYGQFAFLLWRSVYITKQVRPAECVMRKHTRP